jgi:type IV pilus assembly protein PilV
LKQRNLKSRRGFTILEVIVAIVILSMGILGLAGTAASVTRMVGSSDRYAQATALATQRFEIMRGTSCATMGGGSSTQGRYTVAWTVADVTNGKQVTITVTAPSTRGTRTHTFTQIISCQI